MTEIPKNIQRLAATIKGQHALMLLLDGLPYIELTARTAAAYMTETNLWKRKTLPSLSKSQVRFFCVASDGDIKELDLIRR